MKICSRTKAVLRAFLFVVAVGIFTTAANAATVAVGNCEPGLPKYSTIQIAVDSVPPNSTIKVCPGTYPEQVTISKSLTLSGDSTGNNDAAIVTPPAGGFKANATEFGGSFPSAAQILVAGYSNGSPVSPSPVVKINNIIVDAANNGLAGCSTDIVGFFYQDASGTLNHVTARNQQNDAPSDRGCQNGLGVFVESDGSGTPYTVTVQNSSVHNYQKNGITGDGYGTTLNILSNNIQGYGPTDVIAQNGIQISDGATGKVTGNTVTDDFYTPNSYSASGILFYDSLNGISSTPISQNQVANTNLAVVLFYDGNSNPNYGDGGVTVANNRISGTQYDGVDACSTNNSINYNNITNSGQSAIHFDTTSGVCSGIGNSATGNTITEACVGILLGSSSGGTFQNNSFFDTVYKTSSGDVCPAPPTSAGAQVAGRTGRHALSPIKRQ